MKGRTFHRLQEWVLGLTENDLAYQNVLTRVTPGTTNPCKSGLWDVLRDSLCYKACIGENDVSKFTKGHSRFIIRKL